MGGPTLLLPTVAPTFRCRGKASSRCASPARASSGDPGLRREFRLGGSDGNAALGVFGSDAISLLRGFEDDVVSGTRVTVMNAELRVPVVWPQRGVGHVAGLPSFSPRNAIH